MRFISLYKNPHYIQQIKKKKHMASKLFENQEKLMRKQFEKSGSIGKSFLPLGNPKV